MVSKLFQTVKLAPFLTPEIARLNGPLGTNNKFSNLNWVINMYKLYVYLRVVK
jgi:hypothetical protein